MLERRLNNFAPNGRPSRGNAETGDAARAKACSHPRPSRSSASGARSLVASEEAAARCRRRRTRRRATRDGVCGKSPAPAWEKPRPPSTISGPEARSSWRTRSTSASSAPIRTKAVGKPIPSRDNGPAIRLAAAAATPDPRTGHQQAGVPAPPKGALGSSLPGTRSVSGGRPTRRPHDREAVRHAM